MSYALDNPRFFTILPNGTLYELLFELMQTSNNKGEISEKSWIRVKTKKKLKMQKYKLETPWEVHLWGMVLRWLSSSVGLLFLYITAFVLCAEIVRIVSVIIDVMLPRQLNDYSDLSFERIQADLTIKQLRNDQQIKLIHRNLTNEELSEIKRKSVLLLNLHEHEKSIQDKQKEIVSRYLRQR